MYPYIFDIEEPPLECVDTTAQAMAYIYNQRGYLVFIDYEDMPLGHTYETLSFHDQKDTKIKQPFKLVRRTTIEDAIEQHREYCKLTGFKFDPDRIRRRCMGMWLYQAITE